MLSCDQVVAELEGYLDDAVAEDVLRRIRAHLAHCRTCHVLYDSMQKTLRIVTESATLEIPEEVSTRLMAGIMGKVRKLGRPPSGEGSGS